MKCDGYATVDEKSLRERIEGGPWWAAEVAAVIPTLRAALAELPPAGSVTDKIASVYSALVELIMGSEDDEMDDSAYSCLLDELAEALADQEITFWSLDCDEPVANREAAFAHARTYGHEAVAFYSGPEDTSRSITLRAIVPVDREAADAATIVTRSHTTVRAMVVEFGLSIAEVA